MQELKNLKLRASSFYGTALLVCWAAFSSTVRASDVPLIETTTPPRIVLEEESGKYPVGRFVQFLEDKEGSLTVDDIISGKVEDRWINSTWETPNFGFSRSVYWFRFQLENKIQNNEEFLLELGYPLHNELEFYRVDSGRVVESVKTGNLQPFKQRGFEHMNFVFPLSMDQDEVGTYYLKSRSSTSMQFPLVLWSVSKFAQEKTSEYGGLCLYYGIVIVMIFYNLFLSISMRKINYLYYVLYISSLGFFQSSLNGLTFQYLWPQSPWWATHSIPFFLGSTMFWLFLFSQNFLETKTQFPRFHKLLKFLFVWAILIMTLSFVVPYSITIRLSASLSMFGLIFLAVLGIWSARTGYRASRFYVAAFIMFFIGGILASARMFGLLSSNFFTLYGTQLGSAIEIILLSLALGDKIRFEQITNHKKIKNLNSNLNDLNAKLEDKVREKTHDIRAILDTIEIGIFTINRNKKVDLDYSAYMHNIFGRKDFAGLSLMDVLGQDQTESSEDMSRTDATIRLTLGEDEFNFQNNKNCLIRKLEVKSLDQTTKTVSIDWIPMTQNGIVEKILVSVKDVSELVKIQDLEKRQREELDYISEIISTSESEFADFMNICRETLLKIDRLVIDSAQDLGEVMSRLRMDIHTLKGNAHFIGFKKMSEAIHHEEQYLHEISSSEVTLTTEHLMNVQRNIWSRFHTYERINKEVLRRADIQDLQGQGLRSMFELENATDGAPTLEKGDGSEALLQTERRFFEKALNVFRHLDVEKIKDQERSIVSEVLTSSFKERYKKLTEFMTNLATYSERLAEDLGKEKPDVLIEKCEVYINREAQNLLRNSFLHIFRNALDHGIETTEERLKAGKTPQGKIQIGMEFEGDNLVLRCSDDGRGINLQALRAMAVSRGLIDRVDDPVKLADLIFDEGVSTRAEVTDISGRGVGMGAIKSYFEAHSGAVQIELVEDDKQQGYQAFMLKLTIPSHMFVADRKWLDALMSA